MSVSKLHQYVSHQAERRPEATAVVMRDERLTYQQLEVMSDQLATLLFKSGCKPGDRVALMLPKEPQTIICMLAVLKCGAAYVPMDIQNPAERVSKMVTRAAPSVILANKESRDLMIKMRPYLENDNLPVVGWMEREEPGLTDYTTAFTKPDMQTINKPEFPLVSDGDQMAHILFTSGSTGTPKGVMVTHDNVIHFVDWGVRYFDITPADRVSGHAPLHFDLSTFDIYGAFAAGAELNMVPPDIGIIPSQVARFMEQSRLTQWFSVPSLLSYMARFDAITPDSLPHLKRLIWCGEVFPVSALRYWMYRLPHVEFTNLYGPTETTIASSYYTLPAIPESDDEEVPIGNPCDGEELLILDHEMNPVPDGEIGDLYIQGAGLTQGYWQDDEKTAEVFRTISADPDFDNHEKTWVYKTGDLARRDENGLVFYHGREDNQVKTRGYRVELGEVENGMFRLPGVKECAVVPYQARGMDAKAIGCAFVMEEDQQAPDLVKLRKELSEFVPSYAIPTKWLELEKLPRNGNGKIDRKSLTQKIENYAPVSHS